MWIGKLYPDAPKLIEAHLAKVIGKAADVAGDILDESIALHFTSGRQWKGLPHPSSGPGELPQEQSGTLRDSIKFYHVEKTRWHVGFTGLDERYLRHLEFAPPEMGGRAPLSTVMMDRITHDQMAAAIERESQL